MRLTRTVGERPGKDDCDKCSPGGAKGFPRWAIATVRVSPEIDRRTSQSVGLGKES
jgi:hypothetical protein